MTYTVLIDTHGLKKGQTLEKEVVNPEHVNELVKTGVIKVNDSQEKTRSKK